MNDERTIEQRITTIVCDLLGVKTNEVTPQASFVDDLGADSLDVVGLVMEIEEEFELEVPDTDAEQLQTLQQAVDYVSSHVRH